ncbi:MAG: glycosyltransferase [Armatimonadetes bacterium]|nr:glycosyltransferase [Armatimonadota bacterium]
MSRRDRDKRLVYVLGRFPSLSETFILREMRELEERGLKLAVMSLEPGDETVHADARELARSTVYRPHPLSLGTLAALLLAPVLYPVGYLGSWLQVMSLSLRNPSLAGELVRSHLAAASFACALRGRRVAHVHAHFASMPATVGMLLAQMLDTTFSFSAHARDLFTDETRLLDHKLREAEFVTVCTRYGLDYLRRQYPLASADRLHLAYHGIDVVEHMPRLGDAPPDQTPLILSVGRLVEKKGYPILLRAAAILRRRGVDFELHIVGSGPEEDDLRSQAHGLALDECVRFHGPMPHEKLLPLFQRAALFVLACVVASDGDRDGLPNVFLEALAMGVPAVGTRVSAIPELIEHEETGLLATPGDPDDLADQMERLLFDEQLRAHVIEQGRLAVVTKFDVKQNVGILFELFERVMTRRR